MFAENQKGRLYPVGVALPAETMLNIKKRYSELGTFSATAEEFKVDWRTVKKVVRNEYAIQQPRSSPLKSPELLGWVEQYMLMFPHTTVSQLTQILQQQYGINIGRSYVNKIVLEDLGFSRKRMSQIAKQRTEPRVIQMRNNYVGLYPFHTDKNEFVFIDESHFDYRDFNPIYGYTKVGVAALLHQLDGFTFVVLMTIVLCSHVEIEELSKIIFVVCRNSKTCLLNVISGHVQEGIIYIAFIRFFHFANFLLLFFFSVEKNRKVGANFYRHAQSGSTIILKK